MFHLSMGCFHGGCQSLATVTDGTAVFFRGMILQQRRWMGGEGLFGSLPARIIDAEMAGDTAVGATQRFDVELFDGDLLPASQAPSCIESGFVCRVRGLLTGCFQPLEIHLIKRLLHTSPLLVRFLPEEEEGAEEEEQTEAGKEEMFAHRSEIDPRRLHNVFHTEKEVQSDFEYHTAKQQQQEDNNRVAHAAQAPIALSPAHNGKENA